MDPHASNDESRPQRIRRLVDDCLSRQVAGEAVSFDEVGSSHADLMPELGEALRCAALIGKARLRARSGASDVFVPPGYDIIREIRRGGQGVVFEAVQRSTGRTVAIKWMRDGAFAGAGDRMRFEREVHILAQLNHPNIVTIHDSGVTPTGHNYFVMNYISGAPLDEYIDRIGAVTHANPHDDTRTQASDAIRESRPAPAASNRRGVEDIRAGLVLFRKVCEAVHAAHLRGIIHRDLKPSNIRVDERDEPHVLDFGLAKVSGAWSPSGGDEKPTLAPGELLSTHVNTQTGQFLGSLPWASPEQVEGRPDLIDIRADVYSLGVILFQLLTGRYPYPVFGPIREVMDHIAHTPPDRPRTLRPEIDDEIETIVLKCLAKEPDRRYQGAGELARDIERYLAGDAIEAKRDSIHYILRKQLRRYRVPLGIAAAFFILIVAGLGVSLYSRQKAIEEGERARNAEVKESRERDRAERNADAARKEAEDKSAINRFLQSLLASANPRDARDRNITVRTALDQAARKLDQPDFAQSPRIEAAIRSTLGQTYRSLGEYAIAEPHLKKAVDLYERHDAESIDAVNALNSLGLVLIDLDRSNEALAPLNRAIKLAEALPALHAPDLAQCLNSLANAHFELDNLEQAEALYRRALLIQREHLGNDHIDVAESLDNLGMLLTRQEKYDEAQPLLRDALAIHRRQLDERHPHLATTLCNLAAALAGKGEAHEAERLVREALDIRVATLGEAHPHSVITFAKLARILAERHEDIEAEALFRKALTLRRTATEFPELLADSIVDLARFLGHRNAFDEAEKLYREALDIRQKQLGADHMDTAEVMNNLAGVLSDKGELDESLNLYRGALGVLERTIQPDDLRLAAARNNVANVLRQQGKYDEAEPLHRSVLASLQARYPQGHPFVARSMCNLARTLSAERKFDEAIATYQAAVAHLRELYAPIEHFDVADALADLARAQSDADRHADAETSLRDAAAILKKVTPSRHPAQISANCQLAECLARQGKFEDAEKLWTQALADMMNNPSVTAAQRQALIDQVAEIYVKASKSDDAARWRHQAESANVSARSEGGNKTEQGNR